MLKTALRSGVAATLHRSGLLALHRRMFLRDRALVLMYHRVLNHDEIPKDFESGMYVTTDAFELQLAHLVDAYDVVSLDTLIDGVEQGRTSSKPACAITFDDGWLDNYTNAFPLLKRFEVPATVFLVTSQIGGPDMLSWDHVREMEAAGVSFASHTVTHRELTILTPGAIEWELAESKRQLEAHVANPSRWFCYPKGYMHATARQTASRHYSAAVSTRRGPVERGGDRFAIPRIGVHQDVSSTTTLFALRLSGLQ